MRHDDKYRFTPRLISRPIDCTDGNGIEPAIQIICVTPDNEFKGNLKATVVSNQVRDIIKLITQFTILIYKYQPDLCQTTADIKYPSRYKYIHGLVIGRPKHFGTD